jgi:hypothetical protein
MSLDPWIEEFSNGSELFEWITKVPDWIVQSQNHSDRS